MVSRKVKVITLTIGNGMTSLVMLISGIVIARVLSKHDFSTVRQTLLVYNVLAPILLLGLHQSVYYFLSGENNKPRGILINFLTLIVALSTIFGLIIVIVGSEFFASHFGNPDLTKTLRWMIPYPLFIMPISLLPGIMVVRERVISFSLYNVGTKTILAFSIIIAAYWTRSYEGPLIAHIIVPALMLPAGIWLAFFSVPGKWSWPSFSFINKIVKFSVPMGMASMCGAITMQMDKVIVSTMTTPENFAVYAIGAVEIPLIGIITGSVSAVLIADMKKCVENGDFNEAVRLFRLTAEKTSYIIFPCMFFLFVCGDSIIQTLYSEKYARSVIPFRWYLLLLPARTVIFNALLMATNQTKTIFYRAIISLLINTVLSIIFVNIFGPFGAAVSAVLTIYCWSVVYNLYSLSKRINVDWRQFIPFKIWAKEIIFLLILSIATWGINMLIRDSLEWKKLIVSMSFYGFFVLLWWDGKVFSFKDIFKKYSS